MNSITFYEGNSGIQIRKEGKEHKIPLREVDGLYEMNSITFYQGNSGIQIMKEGKEHKIPLKEVDGLYEILGSTISVNTRFWGVP